MNDQDVLKVFRGRRLYGLEILDELSLSLSQNMRLWRLYPILNRLEKEDLISSEWGEEVEDSGGARRKYYRITSRGVTKLRSSTTTEFSECNSAVTEAAKA
jgi:PadR family transcriptional regulator, regulatory protein PadR